MENLNDVSTEALYAELKKRGHYVMVAITAEQVAEIARDENMNLTDDNIKTGLDWLWRNYDTVSDWEPMVDYAIEKAQSVRGQ